MKSYVKIKLFLTLNSKKRTNYIIKHKVFKETGENFFFQPRLLPSDPKLIKFHNNDYVASNVTFITHDIINYMVNNIKSSESLKYYASCIEIMDNVFIGSKSIILPNVRIGNNVIVAAGSVVVKDVEDNSVVGGNPAKKICTFDEFLEKRKNINPKKVEVYEEKFYDLYWKEFEDARK